MLNMSDYVLKAQNTLKNVTNINDILRLIYRYFIDIKQHWLQKNTRKNLAYRLRSGFSTANQINFDLQLSDLQ